jgi:hypothetical protein
MANTLIIFLSGHSLASALDSSQYLINYWIGSKEKAKLNWLTEDVNKRLQLMSFPNLVE